MTDERSAINTAPEKLYRGVAAEDIPPQTVVLSIICPELLPQTSFGSLGQGITTNNFSLKDRDGKPIFSRVVTANHIVATWEGANFQRYPPMIKKGEPVEVYRRANTDKFYWRVTGRGRDFRTSDRMVVEVAAGDPNKPPQEKNDTNTYSATLDPVDKKVRLRTSKANGEACAMVLEADLAKGTLSFSDDSQEPGNRIYLDTGTVSGTPVLQLNLSTGIALKMQGKDLLIKVPGKLLCQADDRIVLDSPLTVLNRETTGQVIINSTSIALNASRDFIVKAGSVIGLNALSVKVSGILSSASAKITNLIKGPSQSAYKGTTISQPESSAPSVATNSADVDLTGIPYKS